MLVKDIYYYWHGRRGYDHLGEPEGEEDEAEQDERRSPFEEILDAQFLIDS